MADRGTALPAAAGRYAVHVNAVMDHVRANLSEDLSLAELAKVANFSPFHFHRMFKAGTGETVAEFTRRARLERAITLMRGAPSRELGSIGVEVGFATPSDFSRHFRARYGIPPSRWDRWSSLKQDDGGTEPDVSGEASPWARDDPSHGGAEEAWQPTIVDRPSAVAAYVRVKDPWTGDSLAEGFEYLTGWLSDRGVMPAHQQMVGLSWESERATPVERLVYDLAITVPDGFERSGGFAGGAARSDGGGIGLHRLAAGRSVEVRCSSLRQTAAAWDYLYGGWLPSSGYEPADRPAAKWFRVMPERFDADAWQVDCSIPIRSWRG